MSNRIEALESPYWYVQPDDGLPTAFVEELIKEPVFADIFGDNYADYQRNDWGIRSLPAVRAYNTSGVSNSQTGYILGTLVVECILPPSIKRNELQRFPNLLRSALLAQLRRPSFFAAMLKRVPGLNQLGAEFRWDGGLLFRLGTEATDLAPILRLDIGYRIDKAAFDRFMEEDDREIDTPFEKTLGDLRSMTITLKAVHDDGSNTGITITTTGTGD